MTLWLKRLLMEQAGAGDGADKSGGGAAADAGNGGAPVDDKGGASGDAGDKGGKPEGYWPDTWLERLSGGDEKVAKRLGRYSSVDEVGKALIAAQNRISSGELKPVLHKDASDQEIAAWRKEMGIPEKPDGYDLKFDSGLVIGKEDKPIIDGFLGAAHTLNLQNEQVKGAIEWYYAEQERQTEERVQLDDEQRVKCLDELNEQWGGNFRGEMNRINGVLNLFPESVREELKGARLPDGTGVFNHPDVMRAFAAISHELNPAGIHVPADGGDIMKGVDERIKEIEGYMQKHRSAYNKDEGMQKEYRDLLEAREKQRAKQAA